MRTKLLAAIALLEYALARGSNALSLEVMEKIENERMWVPLSDQYPNLMGVMDEDIERYKEVVQENYEYAMTKSPNKKQKREFLRYIREYVDIIEKDYFKFVRMLNRQEVFEIAIEIGKRLPFSVNDDDVAFVTSPRGGYEFLSIFAYANDIQKDRIPSIILEDVDKSRGLNFVGEDFTDNIDKVVIVDDIIASGQQTLKMNDEVESYIRPNKIINATIAMREWPWAYKGEYDEKRRIYNNTIYGIKTIGIRRWRDLVDPDPEKDIITVGFPWSIPDGESDVYLQRLYGGRWNRGRMRV